MLAFSRERGKLTAIATTAVFAIFLLTVVGFAIADEAEKVTEDELFPPAKSPEQAKAMTVESSTVSPVAATNDDGGASSTPENAEGSSSADSAEATTTTAEGEGGESSDGQSSSPASDEASSTPDADATNEAASPAANGATDEAATTEGGGGDSSPSEAEATTEVPIDTSVEGGADLTSSKVGGTDEASSSASDTLAASDEGGSDSTPSDAVATDETSSTPSDAVATDDASSTPSEAAATDETSTPDASSTPSEAAATDETSTPDASSTPSEAAATDETSTPDASSTPSEAAATDETSTPDASSTPSEAAATDETSTPDASSTPSEAAATDETSTPESPSITTDGEAATDETASSTPESPSSTDAEATTDETASSTPESPSSTDAEATTDETASSTPESPSSTDAEATTDETASSTPEAPSTSDAEATTDETASSTPEAPSTSDAEATTDETTSTPEAPAPVKRRSFINTAVLYVCSLTDFRESCLKTLTEVVGDNPTTKDLVHGAVIVVVEAVKRAFSHADSIESEDPEITGAIDVCREVHEYIVGDLNKTLSVINLENFSELPGVVNDLQTWLSAAIAYQETCIDSYPDGEIKDKLKKQMEHASEMTSNALAIVQTLSTASSLFSIFGFGNRRLLFGKKARPQTSFGRDKLPSWIQKSDRRLLYSNNTSGFKFTPNVTVAKDGSGDFKTINESLEHAPKNFKAARYVIYVKEGVYEEDMINVGKKTYNVTMYGDGPTKTVVRGSKNMIDGVKTFFTSTFGVVGDGFMAIDMGFENTAGPEKHQAVALRVNADRIVFLNCRIEAYQDTLYAHSNRQFYRDCYISGTVDFIFGDSAAIFQNCILVARKPMQNQKNIFFAQGRAKARENTGFVVQNCKFIAEPDLVPVQSQFETYLGRPWKEFSHTLIMESELTDVVHPVGYIPMNGEEGLNTLTYSEFANTGPGADTSKRAPWPGVKTITAAEAREFTIIPFLEGQKWIPAGIPMQLGFFSE